MEYELIFFLSLGSIINGAVFYLCYLLGKKNQRAQFESNFRPGVYRNINDLVELNISENVNDDDMHDSCDEFSLKERNLH